MVTQENLDDSRKSIKAYILKTENDNPHLDTRWRAVFFCGLIAVFLVDAVIYVAQAIFSVANAINKTRL